MERAEILRRRLHTQHLEGAKLPSPGDVVRGLLAVQGQDWGPAKWSLGARTTGTTDAGMDEALARGEFLRTHVLRPTWHLVAPGDIRWLLELTGPRVHALNRLWYERAGLDESTRGRAAELLAGTLRGGVRRTRAQLQARLAEAGIEAAGPRLAYLLMHSELEGVICSGGLAGRQHTYALLDERAPAGERPLDREAALAELALRYAGGHGPVTARDLSWWASLTLADARRGFDAVADRLERADIDGETWWWAPSDLPPPADGPVVHLLQGLDEYFVGYSRNHALVDADGVTGRLAVDGGVAFNSVVVLDTQLAGDWKRTVGKGAVRFEVRLARALDRASMDALHAAAGAQAAFLGAEPTVAISPLR